MKRNCKKTGVEWHNSQDLMLFYALWECALCGHLRLCSINSMLLVLFFFCWIQTRISEQINVKELYKIISNKKVSALFRQINKKQLQQKLNFVIKLIHQEETNWKCFKKDDNHLSHLSDNTLSRLFIKNT